MILESMWPPLELLIFYTYIELFYSLLKYQAQKGRTSFLWREVRHLERNSFTLEIKCVDIIQAPAFYFQACIRASHSSERNLSTPLDFSLRDTNYPKWPNWTEWFNRGISDLPLKYHRLLAKYKSFFFWQKLASKPICF